MLKETIDFIFRNIFISSIIISTIKFIAKYNYHSCKSKIINNNKAIEIYSRCRLNKD